MKIDRQRALPHMFMPGETLSGAIKKLNLYDVSIEETSSLLRIFKEINGESVLKPGMRALIPILPRHYTTVFKDASHSDNN